MERGVPKGADCDDGECVRRQRHDDCDRGCTCVQPYFLLGQVLHMHMHMHMHMHGGGGEGDSVVVMEAEMEAEELEGRGCKCPT